MSIRFACPGCARIYTVADPVAGRRATCSHCQQRMRIPTPQRLREVHAPVGSANGTPRGGRLGALASCLPATPQTGSTDVVVAALAAAWVAPAASPPVLASAGSRESAWRDDEDAILRPLPSCALLQTGNEPVVYELVHDPYAAGADIQCATFVEGSIVRASRSV